MKPCLQCVQMLQSIRALLLPAVQSRLVLTVNHVLSREPAAMQRLRAHCGRCLRVEITNGPAWLPPLPGLGVTVTPAGLLEVVDGAAGVEPDLRLTAGIPDPAQLLAALAGDARWPIQIDGDAALAADVRWLVDNLRWDIEGDLAEAIGPAPAHVAMRAGRSIAAALRSALPRTDAVRP